jgi:hypothetical protein
LEPRDVPFFNHLKALRQHQYEDGRGEYFSEALYDRVAGVELGDQFGVELGDQFKPDKQPHSRFFALALAVGQVAGGLRVTASNTTTSDTALLLLKKGRSNSSPALQKIKTALQRECRQVRSKKGTQINIGLLDSLYVIPSFRKNSGTHSHTAVHLMRACSTFCTSGEAKVEVLFIMTNKEWIQAGFVEFGATLVQEAAPPVAGQVPATKLWLLRVDEVVPFFAKCGLRSSGPV